MPAFEIIDEPLASPTGTFTPRADQSRYRSMFVCVNGKKKDGWLDEHSARHGVISQDGRARLRYEEFTDDKKQRHLVTFNGMELKEMIVPREDAEQFERHAGRISQEKVNHYNRSPGDMPTSSGQAGTVHVLENTSSPLPTPNLNQPTR